MTNYSKEQPAERPVDKPKANRVFKFEVSNDKLAKFTYEPAETWVYFGDDNIRFQTTSGPFTLDLIRTDATELPGAVRPFPFLTSNKSKDDSGYYVAETKITDGRTPQQRDELRRQHTGPANPVGFIGRYFYKIVVTRADDTTVSDQEKNGEYRC